MSSLFQNLFYIGNVFNTILYGVELMLYGLTIRTIIENRRNPKGIRQQSDKFIIFLSTTLLLLITIYVATQAVFGEEMWIVNANYPGGQAAYLSAYANVWYQTMGTTSSYLLNSFCDGFMIYRCYILYDGQRIIMIPGAIYVGTLGIGILLLYTSGVPSGDIFAGLAEKAGLAYYSMIIGLNFISTCLIVGRILFFARQTQSDTNTPTSKTYINAIAIVVESALPYTLCGIAFLVSYGLGNDTEILFLSLYGMFTCLSPQMIIMRVVTGRAWTRQQVANTMTMTFAQRDSMDDHCREISTVTSHNDGTRIDLHLDILSTLQSSNSKSLANRGELNRA